MPCAQIYISIVSTVHTEPCSVIAYDSRCKSLHHDSVLVTKPYPIPRAINQSLTTATCVRAAPGAVECTRFVSTSSVYPPLASSTICLLKRSRARRYLAAINDPPNKMAAHSRAQPHAQIDVSIQPNHVDLRVCCNAALQQPPRPCQAQAECA